MQMDRRMSPNFTRGRAGHAPTHIGWHHDTGNDVGTGTINTIMRAGNGSYHVTIGRASGVTLHVELTDMAWANGTSNNPAHRLYRGHATHPAVRNNRVNANLWTIAICLSGDRGPVDDARLQQAAEVLQWVRAEVHRIWGHWIPLEREFHMGHNEIVRTSCPGQVDINEILRRARLLEGLSALPAPAPAPTSTAPINNDYAEGETFRLHVPVPGHMTADDARAGRNQRNTMPPGDYHVFRVRGNEINITGSPGRAGSWINALLNIPPVDAQPTPEAPPRNVVNIIFPATTRQVETLGAVNGRHLVRLLEGPDGQPQDDVVLRQILNTFGFPDDDITWIRETNTISLS